MRKARLIYLTKEKEMNNNKKERNNDKYILDACCGSRMF